MIGLELETLVMLLLKVGEGFWPVLCLFDVLAAEDLRLRLWPAALVPLSFPLFSADGLTLINSWLLG